MKKFLSLFLVAVLVSAMFAILVSADDDATDEVTNVALNKEYTISGNGKNYDHTGSVTDGVVCEKPFSGDSAASSNERKSSWFCFYYHIKESFQPNVNAPDGIGYIIIDLEDEYALSSLRVFLIDKPSWGSPIPDAVNAYVSIDGVAYEDVGTFGLECEEDSPFWSEIKVDCIARYLKIEVDLGSTEGYLGEIEAYGVKPGSDDDEPVVPGKPVEEEMKEALGNAFDDAKLDFVIDAPETYKAGDDITVTVTVENITAENGIHVIEFFLYYDNEKLLLTNDLDEEDYNALLCIDELPKGWENLSNVANDWTEETEEGTVVNPLNDGKINVIALTDKTAKSAAVKDDDVLVFTFTFKALENANGDIGLVIPHAEAEGAFNTDAGAEQYAANGDYAVIADSTASDPDVSDPDVSDPDVSDPDVSDPDVSDPDVSDPDVPDSDVSDPDDDTKPGDASSMIIFAIITLIAIAGSAVVIKTRK